MGSFEGSLEVSLKGSFKGCLEGSLKGSLSGSLEGSLKGFLEVSSGWKNNVWGLALESLLIDFLRAPTFLRAEPGREWAFCLHQGF